jgi:hypothetical protein
VIHTAVGVTRRDTPIDAFVTMEDVNPASKKCRILLVGGLDGQRASVDAVLDALTWFYTSDDAAAHRELIAVSAIPCANPDGLLLDKGEENGAGGKPGFGYPPEGKFYQSETNVEAQYLHRWSVMHRADQVIDVRAGGKTLGVVQSRPIETVKPTRLVAVAKEQPENRFPALEISLGEAAGHELLEELFELPPIRRFRILNNERTKPARQTEAQWIDELFDKYCQNPKQFSYIETVPWLAWRRMQKVGEDRAGLGTPPADFVPKSGSELAGLLYMLRQPRVDPFGDFADSFAIVRRAADLAFDKDGQPLAEPPFHNQMSDAVFMNGPLMTGVGAILKEDKYFDCCAQHQAFIRQLCKRDDGLYRHSPLCEAAWGRGNGFAAMGLALMLEDWPEKHAGRKAMLAEFQALMKVLKEHQDYTGTWHQVIDRPESYREFTCTCMIGFAMARGIRGGWLDKKEYQPCVERVWQAVKLRSNGTKFVDVCTGTGKQKTLRDYYDREALTGPDPRAGAMLLMFASEMR